MSATLLHAGHSMPARLEQTAVNNLTDRFAAYLSRVRQMREQSVHMENINFVNGTKLLEEEIVSLKCMYERQLEELRSQLEGIGRERTTHQLTAAKNGAQLSQVSDRLAEERSLRKKTENDLADAHRLLAEKEAQLHESRVSTTQQMNSHEDTKRDRESIASALGKTQHELDNEQAARADWETVAQQLKDKLKFDAELHQKEVQDYRYRMSELEKALLLAEERLHEHNIVDENLSAMLAQIKLNSDHQLQRYKQEAECSYQSHMSQMQNHLDNESRNLNDAIEENIKLKASLEQLNTRNIALEAKCQSLDGQNRSLIQDLEVERQQAKNAIKNLEAKLRELQQALMGKVRELGLAYTSHSPLDLELGSLAALLEAEERRLQLSLSSKLSSPYRTLISPTIPLTKTRASSSLPNVHQPKETAVKQKVRPKTTPGNISSTMGRLSPDSSRHVPITTSTPLSSSMSYIPNFVDYHLPSSSHTGQVRIMEVNPSGKYVRLFNSSSFQDEELGGFMIQQNIAGRPVTVFRFPPRTKLKANAHITVWSASSLAQHNPPSDFLWKDQHKWGTGPECTTILCKPNGQAVAWTTDAFPFGVPKQLISRGEKSEQSEDSVLPDESQPYSLPPDHCLHPNSVQSRVKTGGHDGMVANAQSRAQSICPDRKETTSCNNETLTTSKAGSSKHGGTIRVATTNYSPPSQRFSHGLAKLNSQQRVSFQAPMPWPYSVRKL